MDRKGVRIEVWPVAADSAGLWLISGRDAWRTGPLGDYERLYDTVLWQMEQHGVKGVDLVHSTSWRDDPQDNMNAIITTYVVTVSPPDDGHSGGWTRAAWPDASPIGLKTAEVSGPPILVGAADEPQPRYVDVLFHALRHLRLLLEYDAEARRSLKDPWPVHLGRLTPVLSGMYDPARR